MTTNDADGHERIIQLAKAADLSTKQRKDLWSERFDSSAAIEREFISKEAYSAFMEHAFAGRVRYFGGAHRTD